ncbi:hypothetical protein BJ165DRAFT_1464102 [Panaeolus papilionaceus]|nr:hypothetical protein BJ165DRAFT_1464102 [Panaeolus papilionaceus]
MRTRRLIRQQKFRCPLCAHKGHNKATPPFPEQRNGKRPKRVILRVVFSPPCTDLLLQYLQRCFFRFDHPLPLLHLELLLLHLSLPPLKSSTHTLQFPDIILRTRTHMCPPLLVLFHLLHLSLFKLLLLPLHLPQPILHPPLTIHHLLLPPLHRHLSSMHFLLILR